MTQVQEPRFGDFGTPPVSTRTSVMAILALVVGILSLLICCAPIVGPGLALIGLIAAVTALIFISGGQGRVTGKGLAITGMICSFISLVFGIAVTVGMGMFVKQFGQYGTVIAAAQAESPKGLDAYLATSTAQAVTREEMEDFRKKTIEQVGAYKRVDGGFMSLATAFSNLGQLGPAGLPAKYQSRGPGGGVAPLPMMVEFEKGTYLVIVVVEQTPGAKTAAPTPFGPVENIGVFPTGQPAIWFLDPSK